MRALAQFPHLLAPVALAPIRIPAAASPFLIVFVRGLLDRVADLESVDTAQVSEDLQESLMVRRVKEYHRIEAIVAGRIPEELNGSGVRWLGECLQRRTRFPSCKVRH